MMDCSNCGDSGAGRFCTPCLSLKANPRELVYLCKLSMKIFGGPVPQASFVPKDDPQVPPSQSTLAKEITLTYANLCSQGLDGKFILGRAHLKSYPRHRLFDAIELQEGMPPETSLVTVAHEMFHGIVFLSGMVLDASLEEAMAVAFSASVIRRHLEDIENRRVASKCRRDCLLHLLKTITASSLSPIDRYLFVIPSLNQSLRHFTWFALLRSKIDIACLTKEMGRIMERPLPAYRLQYQAIVDV